MKKFLILWLATALCSHAALIQFDLSPQGTSPGVGLSPANEVPAVTNSTGSGNEIAGGIVFDSDTLTLSFAIGYGSSAGFTDLTGPATAMHIHGPAPVGIAAPVLISLDAFNTPATNPAKGGVISGSVAYPTNQVANLLAGSNYINIHTALNPNGEIRGQLIAAVVANSPPSVSCPPASTVECGTPTALTVQVSDPDGDAMSVAWSVNGTVIQTNSVAASATNAAANVSFSQTLPLGTNIVTVTATDTASNAASCSVMIVVVDTTPPVITSVRATPNVLWPPNHKFVSVKVSAAVTDACGPTTWKVTGVSSSEAVTKKGDDNTSPDWQISGDHMVKLRAERLGKGNGRIYTITVQATDSSGNLSTPQNLTVTVPHDKGKGNAKGQGSAQGNGNGQDKGNGQNKGAGQDEEKGHDRGRGH